MSWEEQEFRRLADELGYEIEEMTDPQVVALSQQVDELSQWRAQAELDQRTAIAAQAVEEEFDRLGIPESIRELALRQAFTLPVREDGYPDIHMALEQVLEPFVDSDADTADAEATEGPDWDALRTDDEARRQAMAAEWRRQGVEEDLDDVLHPDAPVVEAEPPNLDDDQERQAWMRDKWASLDEDAA